MKDGIRDMKDRNYGMQDMDVSQRADVLIDKAVIGRINELVYRDPYHECGGIFIGNVSRDQVTGKYTIHVHDVYTEERIGTNSSFTFTTDYLMNAVKHVKKNCRNEQHIIGNFHSHGQYPAFWSHTDHEMMNQSRENCFYMVVSPKHGTWKAIFKDMDFRFYECDVKIADNAYCEHMFSKAVTRTDREFFPGDKKIQSSTFCTIRNYTDTQQGEMDKRFLHSMTELKGKRVLIVGAGTIGNLLTEYAVNSGVSSITIVDMDTYEYWNLPRSSMVDERALRHSKAIELARAAAERSCFSVEITGINADICDLGWGFLKGFDLVLSPVDSVSIRQFIDRGCKLYHIPHITCGTGSIEGEFTGNVISFPADAAVDLEYVWGSGYRKNLEKRRSCADVSEEIQAQVMGFSAEIAGITMDLALKYLLGKNEDTRTVWKYILNASGNGYERDKAALRVFKYGRMPKGTDSELYRVFNREEDICKAEFDRSSPKSELWKKLEELFHEDLEVYRLNLEWSLNISLAYHSSNAVARIEVPREGGMDPVLKQLPQCHVYLVEGDKEDYLVELTFTDNNTMAAERSL